VTNVHHSSDTRIFHKQCVSLANAGYETYFVAPGDSFSEKGVNVAGIGDKPSSRIKRMTSFAKAAYKKALEINAGIYHLHDPELLPYGLKLKRRGKIVIYDSHEDYIETLKESPWIPRPLRGIVSRIYELFEKRICKKIDAIVYVTTSQFDRLDSHNKNTWMITNYPIMDNKELLMQRQHNRKICFAGGIKSDWMHESIIATLNEADATYELAGSASEAYLNKLKSSEGWERVNYRGMLPFAEVAPLIRSCAVGMAISAYVGSFVSNMGTLGNTKLFEYMQNGLPIVCTDFILWKEIIDAEQCGIYVNPYDTDEIKKAVLYLLDNPNEADKMGINGYNAAIKKYNWGTQEKILLDMYKGLTGEEAV
jgi:glycosyltransferase involved in cell wall biosynthesis